MGFLLRQYALGHQAHPELDRQAGENPAHKRLNIRRGLLPI